MQLEERNQKILAKEGRFKRYQNRIKKYKQNRIFQRNERKFYLKVGGEYTTTNQ